METNIINAADVPFNYARCISAACPLASACLRAIAWRLLGADEPTATVLNPAVTSDDATCAYYRDSSPVAYARGFTGMQRRMYPDQYAAFMQACVRRFGRSAYFKRRRGEIAMPPSEQDFVLAAVRNAGAPADVGFDAYERRVNWNGD